MGQSPRQHKTDFCISSHWEVSSLPEISTMRKRGNAQDTLIELDMQLNSWRSKQPRETATALLKKEMKFSNSFFPLLTICTFIYFLLRSSRLFWPSFKIHSSTTSLHVGGQIPKGKPCCPEFCPFILRRLSRSNHALNTCANELSPTPLLLYEHYLRKR